VSRTSGGRRSASGLSPEWIKNFSSAAHAGHGGKFHGAWGSIHWTVSRASIQRDAHIRVAVEQRQVDESRGDDVQELF
jgi:hypothetical protein